MTLWVRWRNKVKLRKHYEYCSSNNLVKVKILSEKEKWLKFHDGQY